MKRFLLVITALIMLLSFSACSGDGENSDDTPKTIDVEAEADAIIEKYSLEGGTRYSSLSAVEGEFLNEDLIRAYYGDAASMPDFGSVEAYAVYIDETKPLKPCEFGIFKMKDGADADAFVAFLRARINMKIQNAIAYPTLDTEPLTTAKFTVKGGYVWYCAVKGGNDEINSTLEGKL